MMQETVHDDDGLFEMLVSTGIFFDVEHADARSLEEMKERKIIEFFKRAKES